MNRRDQRAENAIYDAEGASRAAHQPRRYRFSAPSFINGQCIGVLSIDTYTEAMAELYLRNSPHGSIHEL